MNNIQVIAIDGEKELMCGGIYLTDSIFKVFQDIVGENNVEIKEM